VTCKFGRKYRATELNTIRKNTPEVV